MLVVDDEPGIRMVLTDLLEMEGYQVTACSDIDSAEAKLAEEGFDIALVDVFLSAVSSGLDLVNRILIEYPKTGVVIMTGYADRSEVEKACLAGAYTCIDKPFNLDDVMRIIETVLNK